MMRRHDLSPAAWAGKADLAASTVSRSISPDYESISSVRTLVALAEAVGEETILDFLSKQERGSLLSDLDTTQIERVVAEVCRRYLPPQIAKTKSDPIAAVVATVLAGLKPADDPETERRLIDFAIKMKE